jgi:hypothetical protein
MSTWETLETTFKKFVSRPSPQPPFVGPITAIDGDPVVAGSAFMAEASYFSVRLVEMRLAEGGRYFSEYLPMGVCVAEYTYGAARRRVPLVLSNETVKAMLGDTGKGLGRVEITDMPVVRQTPFKKDNLALFVGLFRMQYSDIAKSVLQMAADVSNELGGLAVGAGIKMAEKLYDRVSNLFQLDGVQARFAFLDGMALKKSGYVLVSGPLPADVDPTEFVVEKSRLALRGGAKTRSLDAIDYCLIAIEQWDSLFPKNGDGAAALRALAGLPFHSCWQKVASLLAARKPDEAEQALLVLRAELISSPDLTEDDRLLAVAGYDAAYTKFAGPLLAKPEIAAQKTRGFRSATPLTGLKTEAIKRKPRDPATAAALDAIVGDLQRPAGGDGGGDDLARANALLARTFTALRQPLAEARAQGAGAAALADALAVGTTVGSAR